MPAPTVEGFPLSLQQKRLWTLLKDGDASEYIARAEYKITGTLNRSAFAQALRRGLDRHEICRAVYQQPAGSPEPVQAISADPETGSPGFEWKLSQTAHDEHLLTVQFPALSADRASLELFMEELAAQYQHFRAGTSDESEPMQYLDYAQWQLELQTEPAGRAGQQFWKSFEAATEAVRLPLDTGGKGFAPCCLVCELNPETVRLFEDLSNRSDCSLEILFLTAWEAFCERLAESSGGFTIGVRVPGRSFEELQDALGLYDRYVPFRAEAAGAATFLQSAAEMRSAMKAAREQQEYFSTMPPKPAAPAFAFLFAWHRESGAQMADGVRFEMREAASHSEPFHLKLELIENANLQLRFWHNARVIPVNYAEVILRRFEAFVLELALHADEPIHAARFIPAEERERVLREFSPGPVAEPQAGTVIELFERCVREHPQRPALICDGQMLDYSELNAHANRLARQLAGLGVKAGAPVAISAQRSFEMIVGLLGIQKAGAAYVPLDPSYPADRLSYVLQDCGAAVLVTQEAVQAKLPRHNCAVVSLELSQSPPPAPEITSAGLPIDPESPAYIIYTSGSTGQPKGVAISHRNLAYSTAARFQYYNAPIANYLLLSSFAFDSSIAGIFWTLAQGGTLTIPREGTHQDPRALARLIEQFRVSHLLALPSFYQAILEQAAPGELASLSTVIVAGEACPADLVQRHFTQLPSAGLYNEYGPTEGTVWSTVHRCDPASDLAQVPIGRPVPNMSVYLLDSSREPVGIGQLGELYIAGPAVAKGYFGRDELSAERFSSDPFDPAGARRLYRTGDLARFRADGLIQFHGRIDEQVKIRGYRIEIGEIESVLNRHPAVREAAVLAREDSPGDKRLVAYLVAHEHLHLSIPELRLLAREKLPEFMVPAQFVLLPQLPLTPNGKLDRKALPAPEELERASRDGLAPRNADEELLASIWADVLKLESVGIEENFFDLGGHSLLAIQVIARVRDSFKVELPMAAFFEAPTIAGMAVALNRCRATKPEPPGVIRRARRAAAGEDILARLNGSSS